MDRIHQKICTLLRAGAFRYGVSLSGLLAFAVVFTIYRFGYLKLYNMLMSFQGIPYVAEPFSDMSAVAQAAFCARHGVNVYVSNSCMGGGIYNYSPFLLRIPFLSLLEGCRLSSGLILAVTFLACLSCLPSPRTGVELISRAVASVSSTVIFALERANLDVVIFLVVLFGLLLYLRSLPFRLTAYGFFLFVGAIKFFPLPMMILVLKESLRRIFVLASIIGLLALVFLFHSYHGTISAIRVIPRFGPLGMDFGAINVPFGLSLILHPPTPVSDATIASYPLPIAAKMLYYSMIFVSVLFAFQCETLYRPNLRKLDDSSIAFLISGSTLIVTCFYLVQNVSYRGIFLLFVFPALFVMRETGSRSFKRRLNILILAIIFLMWEEFFRLTIVRITPELVGRMPAYSLDILFWFFREGVWWWVVVQLSAFILVYLYLSAERLGVLHRIPLFFSTFQSKK